MSKHRAKAPLSRGENWQHPHMLDWTGIVN
jgi:hypothetical protein